MNNIKTFFKCVKESYKEANKDKSEAKKLLHNAEVVCYNAFYKFSRLESLKKQLDATYKDFSDYDIRTKIIQFVIDMLDYELDDINIKVYPESREYSCVTEDLENGFKLRKVLPRYSIKSTYGEIKQAKAVYDDFAKKLEEMYELYNNGKYSDVIEIFNKYFKNYFAE